MNRLLGLPPDHSAQGHHIDALIYGIHWVILVLFVGWMLYFAYALLRFRAREGQAPARKAPRGRFALGLVVLLALMELGVLFLYEVPVMASRKRDLTDLSQAVNTPGSEVLHVRVVAEQFAWNFHYPGADGVFGPTSPEFIDDTNPIGLDFDDPTSFDDLFTINQLHVIKDMPVLLELRSKDVIPFLLPAVHASEAGHHSWPERASRVHPG